MTVSFQKPPNPVQTSVAGTVDVSAQGGGIDVSAAGGAMSVSARNTVDVSARQIDVSAHGVVIASVQGHALVSVEGTLLTTPAYASAGVTANGGLTIVGGLTAASVAAYFLVDSGNRQVVVVSGGNIVASVQGTVDVSARQIDVSAHGVVSAGGTVDVSAQGGVVATSARNVVAVSGVTIPAKRADVSGQNTTITDSIALTLVVATAGASRFYDLTHLSVTQSTTAPSTIALVEMPTSVVRARWNIMGPGGGIVSNFPTPFKMRAASQAWFVKADVSATFYVNAQWIDNA